MRDLYEILGVEPDATHEQIRAAYRQKSKETHNGGTCADRETFEQVQTAWDVLGDPEKRRIYDESGDAQSGRDGLDRLELILYQAVSASLREATETGANMLTKIRRVILDQVEQKRAEKTGAERDLLRLETLRGTYVRSEKGPNVFERVIEDNIRQTRQHIEACECDLRDGFELLKSLSVYQFKGMYRIDSRDQIAVPVGIRHWEGL